MRIFSRRCHAKASIIGTKDTIRCESRDHTPGNVHYVNLSRSGKRIVWFSSISDPSRRVTLFACGHQNYGTEDNPSSVHDDCAHCSKYYCASCNYDRHTCYFCGDYLRHDGANFGGTVHLCYEDAVNSRNG